MQKNESASASSENNDVPGQLGNARLESGFAIRILPFAVDTAYQVPVAFWFFRHKPVHSPHPEHWVDDLVVQQLRQFLFNFLGSQMLQAKTFALAQPEHFLKRKTARLKNHPETHRAVVGKQYHVRAHFRSRANYVTQ